MPPRLSYLFPLLLFPTLLLSDSPPNASPNAPPAPPSQQAGDPPRLPPPDASATKLDLSNGPASLADHLGPLVINKDGTTARITNWDKMTDAERATAMRIVTKRNRQRLAALKEQGEKGEL